VDESLLPPRRKPRRRPWRAVAAAFVPFAGLAAGTGLSRAFDPPGADYLWRWLSWSSAAGLLIGGVWGLLLRRPALWTLYGAVAPGATAGLVFAGMLASLPVREWLADRREASCRESGRRLCTAHEYEVACNRNDQDALGAPAQSFCAGETCTKRWTYRGPYRPETLSRRTMLLCSVTTDAHGNGARSSMIPVAALR